MFKFNHSNYQEFPLLDEGVYSFTIKSCEQTRSKKGDEMLKLELKIDGSVGLIFDYILAGDTFLWKIKHLCEAIGMPELFENDGFEPDFLNNKSGLCAIKIAKKEGYYPKNAIKDYLPPMMNDVQRKPAEQKSKSESFNDDDIPF